MEALQELCNETEKSHSDLLKSSKKTEDRVDELLSGNKLLEQKLENVEESWMEESVKVGSSLGNLHNYNSSHGSIALS